MSKAKGTRRKITKAESGSTKPTAGPKSTDGARSSRQSAVKGAGVRDAEHEPSETTSRTVLDAIMRNTDAMLVYLDRDFNFVAVNPAYARSCRMRPEEFIGKNHFALYPHVENEAIFRRVRDTGEPVFYRDKPFEFPDQPERGLTYWDWNLTPAKDAAGNVTGLVLSLRETTDRRRAEEENKRNEARLEGLLRISQHHADSIVALLDFALDEAIALTDSTIGYVYHYDEAKRQFTLNSWSKDVMEQCRIVKPQTVYQLDKTGVWGEAVRQRAPVVINDFQAYHPLKKGYPREHVSISRYMTVPVFSEGHIVGVIGVANKQTEYDDSDVRQLTLLMDSVWKIVERKKAEQALRESEERYRSLFSEMTEGFALHEMVCDEDGRPCDYRFLQVNPAFEQLTGLNRQDVEGRLVSDILPDEARHWVDLYAPVALHGESVHFDDFSPRLGRYYEIFAYCPAPRQFAVLFLDISERRLAEKRVRDSEQRLRLALEGGRMGYWERDFHDDTNTCSDHVFEVLGLEVPQTEASSDRFLERVHPDDRAALERRLREAVADEMDFRAEFRIIRPDGQVAWLASRAKIIRDEEGRAGRMMGVIYDISQRKKMEAELRRLNEHLERQVEARTEELAGTVELLRDEVALRKSAEQELHLRSKILEGSFQHTMTPVAFMDKQFNFIRVNDAYAKADEKVPEEFVGKRYFDLFPGEEDKAIFEQVVRAKEPYHAFAKPLSCFHASAGATTYWNWLLTPLLDENGEVEFLVLNLEDVTERQLAFEELEKRALQLQRLTLELSQAEDRERRRLAEVLHDDLQQLLVGAKLHLNILANRTGDDEELTDVVGQVRTLITESIDKSRGLSHELSPPLLQQGGLSEALAWLAQQMRTTCGLAVQVDASGDAEVGSEALRTFVYKAAQEMLFNVVKHARVKRARVELRRLSGYVRLVVSDEGQGFDTRQLTERGGAGFGLFSIRERVQLLGGWMKFKSTPGKGSVFVLAIPDSAAAAVTSDVDAIGADAALRSMVQAPAVRHLGSRRIRVLLVDDHKVMRQGIAALLDEEPDIEVVGQAGNGRDAVTLAGQLHPDVIVMDMAMPVLSGDEATRQIRIQLPATRIIGLSISEPGSVSERMLQAGAEVFLSKTDPSEKLLAAIRGLTWHDRV
jgi:PAS domain S-box-containing protein